MKPTPTPDVINLVVAAREFWDANNDLSDESRALDKALEAFSSLVPYENEPDDAALSVPAAAVVGEPVGYLFEMHYGNGRWSGTMFAEAINIPPEDVRNVRPLYASLGGASHD